MRHFSPSLMSSLLYGIVKRGSSISYNIPKGLLLVMEVEYNEFLKDIIQSLLSQ